MKKWSVDMKRIVILIMLLLITMVSCFALAGCEKTDDSNEVIQFEEEEAVEEEPDEIVEP